MTETEKNAIIEILTPILERDGIELVDVETQRQTLRILIHKADGLSLADCQSVNQVVHPILEVHAHLVKYTELEVASPGIDRPLRTVKDFQRNCGRTVEIDLVEGNEERSRLRGTILEVHPEEVVLVGSEGQQLRVKISEILSARIHLRW